MVAYDTYPSMKLFYGKFNTCFRFYMPIDCKDLVSRRETDFWNRKVRFSIGDRWNYRMYEFADEDSFKNIIFKQNQKKILTSEDIRNITLCSIFFHTACRFYDRTGKDLFNRQYYQWRYEMIMRYRALQSRKFLVCLFGEFHNIKLFLRHFIPDIRETVKRFHLNKSSESMENSANFIMPKSFSLPCDQTYMRNGLKVNFEIFPSEKGKIMFRVEKNGESTVHMVNTFKELFKQSMKHSGYKNHIYLPFDHAARNYYQNRVGEIGQLMAELYPKTVM